MWRYTDYLTVSEDFIPVFTEEVDKSHKGNWKFFIPHAQMRDLVEKLIIALERAHGGDKLSLWLTGAYGTGKTFASFVIKHLLEDDLEEIEDYFQKHQILTPLWPRFKALRKDNPYLVVFRSAAGHITSNRRLMVEIQQAIKEKLKEQGYANTFNESIMEQLVAKLSDTSGVFNWEGAFNKYRGRFRTLASAEEVIERLRVGDVKVGEQVAAVLEEEGFTLLDSPADVKAWIKEVIAQNNLRGIVFIWDEFTEFFTNGVPVTPLQELAHATAEMPFYLFLVTHRALNQFTRIDDDSRKKLQERFHHCRLEMTPVTAYKLIANAIETKQDKQAEWEIKRDSLWQNVDRAVLHINILGERVDKNDLQRLAPIHPFTAYLLSTISSLFSSSQRTLFQFLKKNEPGSFQRFIMDYPQDGWYWLTPDYLWQYFFEEAKIETLDPINDILSHYHSKKGEIKNRDQEKVFRVMLLLLALQRQTQGSNELLKPSLEIVKRMFIGTDLFARVERIATSLCEEEIMLAVPSGQSYEYIIPTSTIDHNKLQQCRQRVETSLTFEKMVNLEKGAEAEFARGLKELLLLNSGSAKLRHPLRIVSARELKTRREYVLQGLVEKPYEIGVIWVVAQKDEHLGDSESLALELSAKQENCCILVSQNPLGERRWQEWLGHNARIWYHKERQEGDNQKYYTLKARGIVDEWLKEVQQGRIRAFFRGKQEELSGCETVREYLEELVASVYSAGPEQLSLIATLYTNSFGKAGAEIGLRVAQNVQRPYKDVVDTLKSQGVWELERVNHNSDHPLLQMKRRVEEFFAGKDHVNLKELWEEMQKPPYGLLPSPIGILLFAVLLRPYAQGYYYSDGVNSLPLNPNKLAELIEQVMKGTRFSENYTIRKMSLQGEEFCRLAREIFHLTEEQTICPEEARKNMRNCIIEMGYPLWTLVYYAKKELAETVAQDLAKASAVLSSMMAFTKGEEIGEQEMEAAVRAVQPVKRELGAILNRNAMQEGMQLFWRTYAPQLPSLMQALNLEVTQVKTKLRALLAEDPYLWQEERVKEKLPSLTRELNLIDALNNLMGVKKQDVNELSNYFRVQWFKGKLPLLCYKEGQPLQIAELIDSLHAFVYRGERMAIVDQAENLRLFQNQLTIVLGQGIALTRVLVKKYLDQELTEQEVSELYEALPDLSGADTEEVKNAIIQVLSTQAKQKKITALQNLWQELTGYPSPEAWSEKKRVPIQWLLEGQEYLAFFTKFNNLRHLQEGEIDAMLVFLDNHQRDLEILQEESLVMKRFIHTAAGEYAEIVRRAGAEKRLQDHLYQALGGNVFQWPMRLNEINRLVREWVQANYQATALPQVLNVIENSSADDLRELVKQLVEDAFIGVRVLAVIKKKAS